MTYLFDVNVLIALIDAQHVAHERVHGWVKTVSHESWATCPITENGFVRIIANPKYPNPVSSVASAAKLLSEAKAVQGHVFWPDDLILISDSSVRLHRLLSATHVTDTYLLALAKRHGGKLATLDRRLVVDAVEDGRAHLQLIELQLQ